MSEGLVLVFFLFGVALLWLVMRCVYAAGWNAAVRHHMRRDPMDPTWTTYT
jgi:hypothetical protein